MTAVTCILGPMSVPIGPVPLTLTNFVLYLTVILLGRAKAAVSYLVYLLIGLVGIPVFSGFSGGPGKLLGPTGGYLIGFLFLVLTAGFFVDRFPGKLPMYFLGMVLGTAVTYLFGTVWLAWQGGMSFSAALAAGVLPFLAGDFLKIAAALCVGPVIRKRLVKAVIME